MKRNINTVLSLLLASTAAFAQANLDSRAAILVESTIAQNSLAARSGQVRSLPAEFKADEPVTVLVTLADGYDQSVLTSRGLNPGPVRDGRTLVALTPMQLVDLVDEPGIAAIDLGTTSRPLLVNARAITGVDDIHSGTGLDRAYTGEGVICGMMDVGLDPNHHNFLDADGNQRIKRMWVLTGSNGSVQTLTGANITSYTTDNSSGSHGTHVLGIMAGGYRDRLEQAFFNANGRKQVSTTRKNYYYGVAPDAILAPCCGTLDGSNILLAAENLLNFAKQEGKPAVMNLSLGHNTGPHDGTTNADRYLASIGKEMLVVVAAGNEATDPLSIRKTFTATDNSVKTFVGERDAVTEVVDIWSFDDRVATVTISGYDKATNQVVFNYDINGPISGTLYLTGTYYTNQAYVHPDNFDECFGSNGAIIVTAGVNENNNRYTCTLAFNTRSGSLGTVVPFVTVKGAEGQTVDIYCTGDAGLLSNGIEGFTPGDGTNSINDMACGDNIISVGAFTTATVWPTLNDQIRYPNSVLNDISSFSSYGITPDGRQLPFIAAPGSAIVSSINTYNYNTAPDSHVQDLVAKKEDKSRTSYWEEMSGTSMAAPFLGGVLALWLQADPTLTIDDVKEILKETALNDEFTQASPHRFGCGKDDALAGIKKVLGIGAGVNDVIAESEILVSETGTNQFNIFVPSAQAISARLYSMSGAQVAAIDAQANDATLDASALPAGVYLLSVKAGSASRTLKIAIR